MKQPLNAAEWLLRVFELIGKDWATHSTPRGVLHCAEKVDIIIAAREIAACPAIGIDGDDFDFYCPTFADQHVLATAHEI